MSYYRALGSLSPEQEAALLDIPASDIRALPLDRKVELAFQYFDHKARKKEAFWSAIEGAATGLIPILAFFGIAKLGGK